MSTVGEPQNARSRRTRQALLVAARQLIEEEGFEATTLAAVAQRAGVSPRALYLHFRSRSDLLVTLYRHLGETENLGESLNRVWAAPDAVSAIDEWARHIARAHPRILAVSRAVERARHTDADAAQMWETTMRNTQKGCRRVIERLDEEGLLAAGWTVPGAADMLWALMSWDISERLIVEKRWSQRRYGEQFGLLLQATFVAH